MVHGPGEIPSTGDTRNSNQIVLYSPVYYHKQAHFQILKLLYTKLNMYFTSLICIADTMFGFPRPCLTATYQQEIVMGHFSRAHNL